MTSPIGAVVFDLADVLLEFAGPASLARLSGGRVGSVEFGHLWSSPLADAFYTGACSPEAFATGAVAALRLPVTPATFLQEFRAWYRGPYPGALELVAEVRRHALAACLSNTNEIDVARFQAELDIDRRFDHCFFSNETGLRKPDPACYAYVLGRLGFSGDPGRVIFFDDSLACVDAARGAGMRAYQVQGPAAVRAMQAHLASLQLGTPSIGAADA